MATETMDALTMLEEDHKKVKQLLTEVNLCSVVNWKA